MPLGDITFGVQSYFEGLRLRAQTALLLVLCPNVEDLKIVSRNYHLYKPSCFSSKKVGLFVHDKNHIINNKGRSGDRDHEYLRALTISAPNVARFLDPDWTQNNPWTLKNAHRAAHRLTRVFPSSLEHLTLVVDPETLHFGYRPEVELTHVDSAADALFDADAYRDPSRGTAWCRETWATIWEIAVLDSHFWNLETVELEFHLVETYPRYLNFPLAQVLRSGTKIAIWQADSSEEV
ncbi:hypothetical protein CC78DRAFT_619393 [Lojkania enalia]|uniref:Uncharacterized protein n=1 Tax=Lojkania enalia TaxID=147567 RepID=A0A9P4K3F8_9PLEO|nr:hypothetical protein CC78DRAFT_619393 [Didymosphaeria enalia]